MNLSQACKSGAGTIVITDATFADQGIVCSVAPSPDHGDQVLITPVYQTVSQDKVWARLTGGSAISVEGSLECIEVFRPATILGDEGQ